MKAARTYASTLDSEPECGVKPYRPFLELTGLAFQLTFRRWPLYTAATLLAFALQAALAFVWHSPHAIDFGGAIALPLLTALVYAFVSADAGESATAETLVWERFLERAWAVIVLDFVLSYVWTNALLRSMSTTSPLELIAGLAAFVFSIATVFSDACAVVDDDVTVWTVVPRSIVRSIATVWNVNILARALAIVSFWLLEYVAQGTLYFALTHFNVPQAEFWAGTPIATIVVPPLAAITVLVYRDAARVLR